jgi:hypothetical protein
MSSQTRRLPSDYLDRVLPSVEDLFGAAAEAGRPAGSGVGAGEPARAGGRRKVHFYMDMEDYEVLMRLVGRLAEMQGPVADPHGLVSKVLRVSVKIGLRELVSRVGQG